MFYIILFIFELILLFFISRKLINSIAALIYRFGGSEKFVVNFLAVLFLPGTIFHELAHLLVAGVMMVHVGEMDLVPRTDDGGVRLGSVQIGKTDPLRRMLIGVAPVLTGLTIILGVLYFAPPFFSLNWWQLIIVLLIIFQTANTMFSSKKDMEGVLGLVVAIMVTAILVLVFLHYANILSWEVVFTWFKNIDFLPISEFCRQVSYYMFVPIALDLIIISASMPFIRRKN